MMNEPMQPKCHHSWPDRVGEKITPLSMKEVA